MPADCNLRAHLGSDRPPATVQVNYGPCPRIERQVLREDDDFILFTDSWGILRRDYKHGESMSEFIEFPVKNRDDWERFRAERLDPDHPDRFLGNWRQQAEASAREGVALQLGNYPDVGVFGGLRWLLGDEECLLAFYTDPQLVHDIMDHLTTVYLAVFARVVEVLRIDVIHIWEDMCGRQGPLISPRHWDEFMAPNYQRIRDFARSHDIPIISVDTDGDPRLILPNMTAAGVNYLWPFEVAAGCDVAQIRRRWPSLGMMGGIDKRALAIGPKAIDAEMERVAPVIETGRYIAALDHLVPDDVSWSNYCYYAEALRRRIGVD
jgi:uroporphyrinogen decarboxylase